MTKSEQIAEIIRRRYPCQAVPYGALAAIAVEVGCTRELVRQVANRIGAVGRLYASRLQTICSSCGGPIGIGNKSGICRSCKWIELSCAACGQPVRRLASRLAWTNGRPNRANGNTAIANGRAFCNRSCFGNWLGRNFGWGSTYQNDMGDAEREIARVHA